MTTGRTETEETGEQQ